jgi:UDP-GlcNAc:undecaprenyl-phosphate GlcNAc-1-phosphate transferase
VSHLSSIDAVAVFVTTLGLTLVLTPLALRIAHRRGVLDHPGEIKAQTSPVPYLGGVAIVTSFSIVVFAAAVVRPPVSGLRELATILGLGLALAVVGLVDDLRGLGPFVRLGAEVAAAVVVWAGPTGADLFRNSALNAGATFVWIVGVTNAFNLLDNMDGLSAGIAAIASVSLFVIAVDGGQFLVATLAIALAGCAAGFLRSNFHPARIYMGDAGALFLGFMLSVLCLKLRFPDAPRVVGLFVPVLILGICLFDTSLVTVNRLIHRRNPLSGGRDHTSHRLVFVGIPVPVTVVLTYVAAATLGALAFVLSRTDLTTGLVLIGVVLALAGTFGVLLSLVPVYETSQRRHLMIQEVVEHESEPPAGAGSASDEAEAS